MLSETGLRDILAEAMSTGGDFAEIFFEDSIENNLFHNGNALLKTEAVRICGAGIYVLMGTKSAYAYTNDLSFEGLLTTARKAAGLVNPFGVKGRICLPEPEFTRRLFAQPNPCRTLPSVVGIEKKIKLLEDATSLAAKCSGHLSRLEVAQFGKEQHICVYNSDGLFTEDTRVTDRLRFAYTLSDGKEKQGGWGEYTRPEGWEAYDSYGPMTEQVRSMFTGSEKSFSGKRVKACRVPVVMEAGVCGTLWHEACGHPLESTAIASHSSEYEGLLGQRIATDKVTLIDDGTIPGLYGSRSVDDEGHKTQRNVLIEKGVLKGYLCDRLGARKLGTESTGSGRRQGYMYAPVARMTNTFLETGSDMEENILSSVDEGLYIKSFGGGSGGREFSLAVSEGYWIHNGEITYPVKGIMLTGKGPELLMKVDAVGTIQGYDGGSFCGAASGLCPVTAYQPRIRISEMNVGGEC